MTSDDKPSNGDPPALQGLAMDSHSASMLVPPRSVSASGTSARTTESSSSANVSTSAAVTKGDDAKTVALAVAAALPNTTADLKAKVETKVTKQKASDSDTEDDDEEHLHVDGKRDESAGTEDYSKGKRERRLAMNRASARERRKRKRILISSLQDQVDELQEKNQQLDEKNAELLAYVRRVDETNASQRAHIGRLEAALAQATSNTVQGGSRLPPRMPLPPVPPAVLVGGAVGSSYPPYNDSQLTLHHHPAMTTPAGAAVQRRADEVLAALQASRSPETAATAQGGLVPAPGMVLPHPAVADNRLAGLRGHPQLQGLTAPPPSGIGLPLSASLTREGFMAEWHERKRQELEMLPPPSGIGGAPPLSGRMPPHLARAQGYGRQPQARSSLPVAAPRRDARLGLPNPPAPSSSTMGRGALRAGPEKGEHRVPHKKRKYQQGRNS